eukprot:292421_1
MTLPAINVSQSRLSSRSIATNLRFKTFPFKTSNSNRLEIKKIRIEQEEGPSLHNGIFYLDVSFTEEVHINNIYEEPMLPFMRNHIIIDIHNYLIYSMHRWPNSTRQFIRRNGHLFPLNEMPYDVGDYIEYDRDIYHIDWRPTPDGRIYLHEAYKNKIDIFGGRKVDVARSASTGSVCYEGNGTKRMYWTADDITSTLVVHRGRHTGAIRTYKLIFQMKHVVNLRESYYIAFRYAAQCFKCSRVGDTYKNTFTLPHEALDHIKNFYNLVASKRTRQTPYEPCFYPKYSYFSKKIVTIFQKQSVSTSQYMSVHANFCNIVAIKLKIQN